MKLSLPRRCLRVTRKLNSWRRAWKTEISDEGRPKAATLSGERNGAGTEITDLRENHSNETEIKLILRISSLALYPEVLIPCMSKKLTKQWFVLKKGRSNCIFFFVFYFVTMKFSYIAETCSFTSFATYCTCTNNFFQPCLIDSCEEDFLHPLLVFDQNDVEVDTWTGVTAWSLLQASYRGPRWDLADSKEGLR